MMKCFAFFGKADFRTSFDSIPWVNTMYVYVYLFNKQFYSAHYVPDTVLSDSKININAFNGKYSCYPLPSPHLIAVETGARRVWLETQR